MPTAAPQPAPPSRSEKPSSEEVVRLLNSKNWDGYWQEVSEQVAKEVEAYRLARAKSLASAPRRVMV